MSSEAFWEKKRLDSPALRVVRNGKPPICFDNACNTLVPQAAADIYGTLGQVVAGMKKDRESQKEITIFDSAGLAIQDVAWAAAVYRKAVKKPMATSANPH